MVDNGSNDFEDFGGFEGAEPVNYQQPSNPGDPLVPNVWAAIFSEAVPVSRSVQPDLLCGQNRFPQHLDNPLTVDVAGCAEASLSIHTAPNGELGFGVGFNFTDNESQFDLDSVNLANDILDGSFRSAGNSHLGGITVSHGTQNGPDVSDLDLFASGISDSRNSVGTNRNNNTADDLNDVVLSQRPDLGAGGAEDILNEAFVTSNIQITSQAQEPAMPASNEVTDGFLSSAGHRSASDTLVQQMRSEKERLHQELEKQLSKNLCLSGDLARAHELAEVGKQDYERLKTNHDKRLEELRQAGHDALSLVVEEYKALLSSTVLQQQEMCEDRFAQRLKLEMEKHTDLLRIQNEEFNNLQAKEQKKNEIRLTEAVENMKIKQKQEFDNLLADEKRKFEEQIKIELEKERENSSKKIAMVIQEEQQKAREMLENEQEKLQQKFSSQVEQHMSHLEMALKEQRERYEEELAIALRVERSNCREAIQQVSQSIREDLQTYLQRQREADRLLQRRQLASLDLFLESARQQLSLLMSSNCTEELSCDHTTKDELSCDYNTQKEKSCDLTTNEANESA